MNIISAENTCKTCKTCKHWELVSENWGPLNTNWHEVRGGYCRSENFLEDYGYSDTSLVYSCSEGGKFWTGKDFGCVHHQLKEIK